MHRWFYTQLSTSTPVGIPTPWHYLLIQYCFYRGVEHIPAKLTPLGLPGCAQSWCNIVPLGGDRAKPPQKSHMITMASLLRPLDPLRRRQQTPRPSPTTVYDPSSMWIDWWPQSASSMWSQHRIINYINVWVGRSINHHLPLCLFHIDTSKANIVDTDANGIIVMGNAAISMMRGSSMPSIHQLSM